MSNYKRCLTAILLAVFIYDAPAGQEVDNLTVRGVSLVEHCRASSGSESQQIDTLRDYVIAAWKGTEDRNAVEGCSISPDVPAISLVARADGVRVYESWSENIKSLADLADFVASARQGLSADDAKAVDALELFFSHSYELYHYGDRRHRKLLEADTERGVKGLEMRLGDEVVRYSPGDVIAQNLKHGDLIKEFARKNNLIPADMVLKVSLRMFDGEHFLVRMNAAPRIHHLYRGNETVLLEQVTQQAARAWIDLAASWLTGNVHESGRMTYKYWPSLNKEPDDNNTIRQWMATLALEEVAARSGDTDVWALAEKNIEYNLAAFYREEGDLGIIEYRGKVKLGALAMAALAIVQHPGRSKWERQEKALLRLIDHLWRDDGSFKSFYKPQGYPELYNFYPGEALLLWATLFEETGSADLLDRFMKSFEFYRAWHLSPKNRNPAFIPWHTRAYYRVWKKTSDARLKDFIFEMNDWLIDQMQSEESNHPDTLGRFYKPNSKFGIPHASATGVYLEGLIDAYRLARQTGDEARQEKYRLSIRKGIRSLMQLQFVDDVDMYYVPVDSYRYVRGGLRTAVYDNEIRCDNVQHALMGMLEIDGEFSEEDYSQP